MGTGRTNLRSRCRNVMAEVLRRDRRPSSSRMEPPEPSSEPRAVRPDVMITAARAAVGAIAVAAIAFGLWKVRSVIILLLLALTFAAAMRPGVEWLHRRRVPEPLAILSFFVFALGAFALFFWLAVPAGSCTSSGGRSTRAASPAGAAGRTVQPERAAATCSSWLQRALSATSRQGTATASTRSPPTAARADERRSSPSSSPSPRPGTGSPSATR